MALPIITADQRRAQRRGVKIVILGVSGIGKTTQLKSLDTRSTLFIDLEAGDLSVSTWDGDCLRPRGFVACASGARGATTDPDALPA